MKAHSSNTPSQKKRPTIGLLTRKLLYPWILPQVHGVVDACRERDINLVSFPGGIISHGEKFEAQDNIAYDLASTAKLDGLIILTGSVAASIHDDKGLKDFYRRFQPRPIVGIERPLAGIPTILKSEYETMGEVMAHLIEVHGHRRIAYINRIGVGPQQERYQAYKDTLAKYGLPYDPNLVLSAHDNLPDFNEHKLRPGLDFEAVMACDDVFALEVLQALQNQGIRVPEQVAVTGFDDMAESWTVTPPLTTVRPPFYEMGHQAVEMVLALLAGEEVPEQVTLPCKLVTRQSCGCMAAEVAQSIQPTKNGKTFDSVLTAHRADIVADMAQVVSSNSDRVEPLLDGFVTELKGQSPGLFLRELNDILRQVGMAGGEIRSWQQGLWVLHHWLQPGFDSATLALADDLWHRACMIIGETAERRQAYQALQTERQAQVLREVGQELITTFEMVRLMDILAGSLPRLNFPASYLALYETPQPYQYPQPNLGWSRLMLAYDGRGRVELEPGGQRFPTAQLLPEEMWPDRPFSLIVEPLYFQNDQIGFALFDMGPREGTTYEALRGQISSALQGALLVQRVQDNAAEIARQKYVLDSFMDNVPDTIYFKDHDSRLTQVNRAFVDRFGIAHSADIVGKSDFDLFSEEEARPKYDQEQEIIRTGQPILDLEEPDVEGKWALTTKMPLRDENNNIIGTFGISRDITELKHAQHDVEIANKEINTLNEQLKEENLRMSAELDVARRLQEMILPPPEELKLIEGLDIVGFMQPADEVGGDYYDVLHKNGTTHIGIGDVTGHGLESGVLMLMTQTAIRTLIDHGETDPVKFVNTLNRTLYGNIQRTKMDKSLTFALVNFKNGQLKIVGQHEEMLVVKADGQVQRMNTLDLGFPLGLKEEITQWVNQAIVELAPGEGIVLYTDGFTEAANDEDELYGLERLCEVVSQNWHISSAEEVKQAVVEDVTRHIGQQIVYDDLTMVVLKQQ